MDDFQEEIRSRQCGRKLMFTDIEAARRAAKVMHKRNKARYTVYECQWCGHLHVGTVRSTAAAERRAARRSS